MMGEKDNKTKIFMEKPENFADAFNFLIFNGKPVIKPDDLIPVDSAVLSFPKNKRKKSESIKKYRDVIKHLSIKRDKQASYIILAIENQSDIHYAMPVRNMLYDAMQYEMQVRETIDDHKEKLKKDKNYKLTSSEYLSGFTKDDRLKPVVTLVINFSGKPWDGPVCLHEMIESGNSDFIKFISDYKLNLIDPARIKPNGFKKFSSHLKEILLYLKYSTNKITLKNMLKKVKEFKHTPNDVVDLLNTLKGLNIKIDKKTEETDMSNAWQELLQDSKDEGKKEGALKAIEIMYKLKLPYNQIVASIMDSFGYSEKTVKKAIHSLYPSFS